MNVTQENVDALNAIVRIQFTPADYQPQIEAQLRDYSKKVQMPGFRPGKVPAGMVKKMYGKSILVDELNKLTSDTLFSYLRDNQLDVLGNPLPQAANDSAIDLDNPGEINLSFELGLAPKFELDISSNHRFNIYKVKLDASYIDDIIADYRKRLGDMVDSESSKDGDQITGLFEELNADGTVKVEGISKKTTIQFDDIKAGDQQELFTGLHAGSEIVVDFQTAVANPTVTGAILAISKEEAEQLTSHFRFTVESVKESSLAEVNQDFFDKLLGPGAISSEEELRARIQEDGESRYRKDTDNRLFNEVVEHLVNNTRFDLPNEFLKRWLVSQNEGKVNPEDIESNYENYSKGIRWQLIEGKILKDFNIAVSDEDILESFTGDFLSYMGAPGTQDEMLRERAREIAKGMMKNEKEVNKVYDRLYNEAMTTVFLSNFDIHSVELPFDAWVEQLNKPLN
jgi:trigger factor